ncbi:hypothetical protein COCON_G00153430 [Conger conger]|uniref:Helicase-associated putative binding domain-containing protein n=1 Tax=Conger conger TaxID=82655 RepID=A0A9Q1HUQ8_CONCO|nr:hypothetical protein COCON_G00153430 [Conger conger]
MTRPSDDRPQTRGRTDEEDREGVEGGAGPDQGGARRGREAREAQEKEKAGRSGPRPPSNRAGGRSPPRTRARLHQPDSSTAERPARSPDSSWGAGLAGASVGRLKRVWLCWVSGGVCEVAYTHSNQRVVGASRAEDRISRAALRHVFQCRKY